MFQVLPVPALASIRVRPCSGIARQSSGGRAVASVIGLWERTLCAMLLLLMEGGRLPAVRAQGALLQGGSWVGFLQQHRVRRVEHAANQFGGGDEGAVCRAGGVEQIESAAEQGRIAGGVVALATVEVVTFPCGGGSGEAVFRCADGPGLRGAREEQQWLLFGRQVRLDQATQAVAELCGVLRANGFEQPRAARLLVVGGRFQ